MEDYINQTLKILHRFFKKLKRKLPKETKTGVLISGGIDSSIIAKLTSLYFEKTSLFSFGTDKTKDLPYINLLQKHLNLPLAFLKIGQEQVKDKLTIVKKILKEKNIETNLMQLSLAMGYFLIFQQAKEKQVFHLFTGQGPDIVFAGYHKYQNLPVKKINQEIKKDLYRLEVDKKRDQAMAEYFNINLYHPYLEKDLVRLAVVIPGQYKLSTKNRQKVEKYLLRKLGEKLLLPREIVWRKKMAFQYSTGIQKLIKNLINF